MLKVTSSGLNVVQFQTRVLQHVYFLVHKYCTAHTSCICEPSQEQEFHAKCILCTCFRFSFFFLFLPFPVVH